MKITLNNREEKFDVDELTISELLKIKNYTFHLMITKVNGKLFKKADRENAKIHDGDAVAVIHMISGG
ncbi:MAG: thiamine biosynthesis protein ThiS [Bacteroidetes bacterium]|nr:MAG: thiamine biosynthesis protein ThiS [Bacteroidota bacterium]